MITNKHSSSPGQEKRAYGHGAQTGHVCTSEKEVLSSGHMNRPGRGKTDASLGGGACPRQGQIHLGLSPKGACGCLKHTAEQGKSGFWGL